MTNVANTSRHPIVLRDRDGKAHSLASGETAQISVDEAHPAVAAHLRAGNIALGGTKAQAEKAARTATGSNGTTPKE